MRPRVLATTALSALVVAGAIPLLGAASAAACPTWTDAKGDASTGQARNDAGVIGDDNLDVTGASLKSDGTNLTAVISVVKLNATSSDMGDEFRIRFTIAGKQVDFYADRGKDVAGTKTPGYGAGFYNGTDDAVVSGATATFDVKTSTVTIVGTVANLAKAVGAPVAGKPATGLTAQTLNQAGGGTILYYDQAPAAAAATVTPNVACTGGSGPAPTTSPTAAPSPTATPTPTASPTATPSPTNAPVTCFDVADAKGDAPPVAEAKPAIANDPDIDIVGVTYQATADKFVTYIKVDKLATRPAHGAGHAFFSDFTFNKLAFSIFAASYDPSAIGTARNTGASAVSLLAPTAQLRVAGSYKADVPVEAKFDIPTSTVTLSVPRAGIAKYTGGVPFADGAELTLVTARSRLDYAGYNPPGGDATGTPDTKLVVGSNKCFGPPAAKLLNTGKTTVQFTDAAAVAAKLTDAAGKALAGKTVTFAVGAVKKTATTGSDGVAKASLDPGAAAGAYSLVTSFAGDAAAGKVELTTPFTVTAEVTKIVLTVAKSGTKRTVTAKLVDDDGKPVAGQNVDWYVAGKKVSTMKTNSAGVVTLTTAKPTQTVVAEFLAVAGKYAASKATTKV